MGRQGAERQTDKDITSVNAQKKQTSTFNFFHLPRELRDSIYDESLIFKRKFEDQSGVRIRGRRLVQIHLLLINRQFRDEYLERAEKKTCLVIVDRDRYHGESLKLPAIMKYTRKLELHLALACDVPDHILSRCKVTQEVRMHRKWIGNLCDQMKHLESVKINVLIDAHEHVAECEGHILKEQHRFTNLENLTSLEIFHCDYYVGHKGTTCAWNFSRPRKVIMQWSAEKGELERVKQSVARFAMDGRTAQRGTRRRVDFALPNVANDVFMRIPLAASQNIGKQSKMGALNLAEWQKLPMSLTELCINTTLRCGQSFRWRKNDAGVWSMALHNRILTLHQDTDFLYYKSLPPSPPHAPPTPPNSHPPSVAPAEPPDDDTLELIKHYFNLTPNLSKLYEQWSASDPNFAKKAPKFTGVRILKQDAWEALVGFICSSNNNIARISQMVYKLCVNYGPLLGHLDGEPYHDFPTPQALAQNGVETKLRSLGFGYRAKYLYQTACIVSEKGEGWLDALRNPESPTLGTKPEPAGGWKPEGRDGYREAHEALLSLQGVGPKVADCVCLMGLGWGEAVPVDTHVWQIAQRDYKFGRGKHSSLTKQTYDAVGAKFRSLWGQEAGWAHSVLFTADLRAFSERLIAKKEEQKEEVEVKTEAGAEVEEDVTKVDKVLERGVKREPEEEEKKVVEVEEKVVRRTKRRRT